MISIDMTSIDREFINWNAIIARSLAGESVSVIKSGIEVLQIKPTANKPTLSQNQHSNEISNQWSPEVLALAGSWADFPTLDEIRSHAVPDVERESL